MNSSPHIPKDFCVGRLYHCSWASNRGFVWRLISFNKDTNTAEMMTPKTKKKLTTQLDSLRNTNKNLGK